MALSIAQKQNYLYVSLILLTMVIAIFSYRVFQKKWLIFREAENKFHAKEFKEAIDLYKKSLEIGQVSSIAFIHLGDAYVAEGNFSEAIKWYRLYLDLHPDNFSVRYSLAQALSWNGNIEEAQKEYQILLQREDKNDKIH